MVKEKTLGLIACSSEKLRGERRYKAYKLYSASALFRKAYAYCTKTYSTVAILSAKHGLVFPDEEIEPYDKRLAEMCSAERKQWSEDAFNQMQTNLDLSEYVTVFFHVGKHYREYLIPKVERLGIECRVPLENLRIGEQMKWYDTHSC